MIETLDYIYETDACLQLSATISEPRFNSYLNKTDGNRELALRLYLWNSRLSQALYLPVQALEVSLRNACDRQLTVLFKANWYTNRAIAGSLVQDQLDRIDKAIQRHADSKIGAPLNQDYVVANLSFAFWADLFFKKEHEKLWQFGLHQVFPHRAKGIQRSTIAPTIKAIHSLRNRIAHHEPIIWSKNPSLEQQHQNILMLLNWICPQTANWVQHHCWFRAIWDEKPE